VSERFGNQSGRDTQGGGDWDLGKARKEYCFKGNLQKGNKEETGSRFLQIWGVGRKRQDRVVFQLNTKGGRGIYQEEKRLVRKQERTGCCLTLPTTRKRKGIKILGVEGGRGQRSDVREERQKERGRKRKIPGGGHFDDLEKKTKEEVEKKPTTMGGRGFTFR